jgi:hypothetical protein
MSYTLKQVQELVARQSILISDHGYDELAGDDIFVQDVIGGVAEATVIEDYPDYHKGHACWCFSSTNKSNRFTSSGEFRNSSHHLP